VDCARHPKIIERYFAEAGKSVSKVHSARNDRDNQYCVDSYDELSRTQTCFDPATNQSIYLDFGLFPSERAVYSAEIKQMFKLELSDFITLGEKHFPSHLIRYRLDEKVDIRLETFAKVMTFADGLFAAPPGTEAHNWCPSPVAAGSLQIDRGALLKLDRPGALSPIMYWSGGMVTSRSLCQFMKAGPLSTYGWPSDFRWLSSPSSRVGATQSNMK
jgi:hypothetical protein